MSTQEGHFSHCSCISIILRKIFQNSLTKTQMPYKVYTYHWSSNMYTKTPANLIGVWSSCFILFHCYLVCNAYVYFFSGSVSSFLITWPDTESVITICFIFSFLCSAFQVDVTVDLRPLKDNERVSRNVVLLLKCAKPVNWVVKTHNVNGILEIVVRKQCNKAHFLFFSFLRDFT